MSPTASPTPLGTYAPPDSATDDTLTATDVHGAVRFVRWAWRKHLLGYVLTGALALWARVEQPRLTTAGGATAHDSAQDAQLAALSAKVAEHLVFADSAERASTRDREEIKRSLRDVILIACAGLSESQRAIAPPCRGSIAITSSLVRRSVAAGEVR
jgi:hypothetical protein